MKPSDNYESQVVPATVHSDYQTQTATPTKMDSDVGEPTFAVPPKKQPRILSLLVRAAFPASILAAGCVAYSILAVPVEPEPSDPAEEQVIRTRVTELQVRDYPVVIKTNGIVQPHNEVTLSAQVSGQVIRISPSFEAGSYFSQGDVLVELDARDYATAVAVAKAQHLAAKSAFELASQNFQRNKMLRDKNGISEAQFNLVSATRLQAAAQLDSTAAQVEQAERDLERTKIRAPFEGRVRQKAVGLGQQVGLGTALGVVFAVDFAEVRLPIASRELQFLDLPELAGDRPVDVELRDAISDASETIWKAKIIRTEGALDENSLELFAIARVDDPFGLRSGHPPLRIGQPVVGSVVGKVLNNVVALPRLAVRQLDRVFLVDKSDLTLMPRTIVPVWSDEEYVIVRDSTIQDGMLLSTTSIVYATEGAKVEIIGDPPVELADSATKTTTTTKPVAN